MSLAAALNTAASGLAAVSRGTDVVAGNIANAMTPGYARREMVQTAVPEGGVRIASVNRMVTASLVGDARLATAARSQAQTFADFNVLMESATGVAGSGATIADKVGDLEAALISAAARPDSDVRLAAVASAARMLADGVNSVATTIEDARTAADQSIASDVNRLRQGLEEVARLNLAIVTDRSAGRDAAALMDDRQRIIDDLSTIVPIREVNRDLGRVALYSTGGAALLDGTSPIKLSFTAAGQITPQMKAGAPPVSPLILDGEVVEDPQMILFAGGSLEANFAIRDRLAPQAQARIDGFARDLVERFSDPTLDVTLAAGAPGLFADRLARVATPVTELGLANRLSVSEALPEDGSMNWRLRDGLGAAAAGNAGRASQLTALADRLRQTRSAGSDALSSAARSVAGLANDVAATGSFSRVQSDAMLARRSAHFDAISASWLAEGVDTDAEMRRLLNLEQAYAANARVIMAADEMISRILEI